MRDGEVRFAESAYQFELILKTVGLRDGADAAKERVNTFVPKIESQVRPLQRIEFYVSQQRQAGVRESRRTRRLARRREIKPLFEQRVGRVGKAAARESGVDFEAV